MHVKASVNIQVTVDQLLSSALLFDEKKEVIYDGYRRLTYLDLQTEATWIASGLQSLGVKKGDRVAVCLPNWHEFIVVLFSLSKIGAILIPLNIRYRTDEVEYILKDSGAKVVFISEQVDGNNHIDMFADLKKHVSSLEHLVTVRCERDGLPSYTGFVEKGNKYVAWQDESVTPDDIFTILYTSGTTGKPKGVMLLHRNVVNVAMIASGKMQCHDEDVFLIPVPAFHVMGIMFILRTVFSKARLVLMEKFKAGDALSLIENEKVTIHPGVPTMFILELNHPNFSSYDLSSLRTGELAAAPCPVEIVRKIKTDMGCNILVAYGLTETSANVTITDFNDSDVIQSETVGRAIDGVELKVVDDDRQTVGNGIVGELACRSIGLMKGYYNLPEQTREAVDEDGWFYTGDLATIDNEGYVRIVGRKKDMIIRGGFNIYPREIEELLYQHPSVLEVAVVGLPDSVLGEISCAVIILKEGLDVTEEEIKAYLKEKLVHYKIPDKVLFMKQLPMTASGKILKIELQNQLKTELKSELR